MMTTGTGIRVSGGRVTADRYALFYAPLSLAVLALAFLPLFKDAVERSDGLTIRASFGTVFDMAGTPAGGPAVLGLIFLGGLVVCLVAATLRPPRSVSLPVAIAALAALIALLLITRPNTGTPKPALTDSGTAGLVLVIVAVLLGIGHAIQLAASRRYRGSTAVSAVPQQHQEAGRSQG
jgi:hypothetical protein